MVRRVLTYRVSDLSGEPVPGHGPTLVFGWGRMAYEIDLTEEELDELDRLIRPYLAAARPSTTHGYTRHDPTRPRHDG
ncbi:Lsr2 dimerization domain-containing protein [Ornithinimicrobium cerasi]|uniref:Lsr2 dimerization domain-containing protein n=1 Tax=Ornithinimicrobium cerasi TaxID=2248773 RepID=UPI000F00A8DF|nr:histone-like nucleoid-structuring protein Lsr2 [Ornithinimicrobium cerasi]